jgi:hypothetical protein
VTGVQTCALPISDGYAVDLDPKVVIMPISVDNYNILLKGKSLEEYVTFFEEHFSQEHVAMIKKWRTRQAEEIREAEISAKDTSTVTDAVSKTENAVPEIKSPQDILATDSAHILPPTIKTVPDSTAVDSLQAFITEEELEKKAAETTQRISEEVNNVNQSISNFASDPIRGILNLFKKKSKKNAIDEYVEQQEKEEKIQQKALKEKQKAEIKAKNERILQQQKEQKALLEQQKAAEKEKLKSLTDIEKEKERLKKETLKQKEAEKKRLAKEREKTRKQKAKDAELRRKQKAKEKKEKKSQ